MSPEKDPNKNKIKPIKDNCNHCSKDYQITAINGVLVVFDKQPDCNFMLCSCTHCKKPTKMFIDDYTLEQGRGNGLREERKDYADDDTYRQMLDVREITLVQERPITDRHEREIGRFSINIHAMPAKDIHEEMALPHDYRPYPQHWA